jgi:NAD+ synthase (glutamine-hydrolysing)
MRVALAQVNSVVGDITGIEAKLREYLGHSRDGVQLVLFPEPAVTGYPPEDLLAFGRDWRMPITNCYGG